MAWKPETIERKRAILEYQREEMADAVVMVLERVGTRMRKAILIPRSVAKAKKMRRYSGIHEWPAIEGEQVPEPNEKFTINHWKYICLIAAADLNKYIVPSGARGLKIGTLEEYKIYAEQTLLNQTIGLSDSINARAEIINRRGGDCKQFTVKELLLPSGNKI